MTSQTRQALAEEIPDWGVLVIESHHAPDFFMEERTHAFLKIIYFLSGQSHVVVEGQRFACQRGDVILVHPGERNRIIDQSGAPVSLYALCLDPDLLSFDPDFLHRLPRGQISPDSERARGLEGQLRRLRFQQQMRTRDAPVSMVALALSILVSLRRMGGSTMQGRVEVRLNAYLSSLETEFFEASTIDEAATRLGMSRRHFTALFRKKTGKTWLQYLRDLRIDHAARLLQESHLPISSVAFECGFEELSTFYRAFRKLKGCTPVQWRERAGSGRHH